MRWLIVAAALGFACAALYNGLTVRRYNVESRKISSGFRIVHLSDLHCTLYGRGQEKLLKRINALSPDIVCLTGDIFDERLPFENAEALIEGLKKYPVYFVLGNHELYSESIDGELDRLREAGICVLDDGTIETTVKGCRIIICGLRDPVKEQRDQGDPEGEKFRRRLAAVRPEGEAFTLLLSHRPERIADYAALGFDLVLSGHAHGGQWRLPFIVNGLYAPHQGLFPKYAGGLYRSGGTTMEVSRGLSKLLLIPRIFNPAEFSCVDVMPEGPSGERGRASEKKS